MRKERKQQQQKEEGFPELRGNLTKKTSGQTFLHFDLHNNLSKCTTILFDAIKSGECDKRL